VLIHAGVITLSEFCWINIRRLCNNYHVILITDDISSGCGKLGSWHSTHTAQYGVQSDINILGKALTGGYAPLAMTFSKEHIWERVYTKVKFGNSHYPFMGGVAAALEYKKIVEEQFLFYKTIKAKKRMVTHMLPEKTNSIGLINHIYFDEPKDYRDILQCGIFHPPRKDKVDGIRFVIPVGADNDYWEKLLPRLEKLCVT
jgi:adenosylmethionine-8-amino-7-oxononanoate aminotransferase